MNAVQVYDGDGLSEADRLAKAIVRRNQLSDTREELSRPRRVQFTTEAQEDLKVFNKIDLGKEINDMITNETKKAAL